MSNKFKVTVLMLGTLIGFLALNIFASRQRLEEFLPKALAKILFKQPLTVGMMHIDPAIIEYSLTFDDAIDQAANRLNGQVVLKKLHMPIDENTEQSIEDLITHDHCKVIFADSAEYQPAIFKIAPKYPEVKFEYVGGSATLNNVGTFFGDVYKVRYLSGVVAGSMVKQGFIGYVAYEKTAHVLNELNAFTLGVRSVNPKLLVKVIWTHNRYDALKCRVASLKLLDLGAELIAQHVDVIYPSIVAVQRGKYAIGNNADFRQSLHSDLVLTSVTWSWASHFLKSIQAVLNHTWRVQRFFSQLGDADSLAQLAPLSPLVPNKVQQQVQNTRQQLISGTLRLFCGELRDNTGKVRQTSNQCLSEKALEHTDWLVEGVSEIN